MNILYIDIDSLRPNHLGCYGYHRNTSPNIDRIAADGVRFTNCYASDAPCLPSRTALFSGLFGIHSGVVNHGGVAAQPFIEGERRGFRDWFGAHAWPAQLRRLGYHTASISTFGERHSAWHWYAGFNEVHNIGKGGNENADEVSPLATDWVERAGAKRHPWFLHLNLWDPHETRDLAGAQPGAVAEGRSLLAAWKDEQLACAQHPHDPLDTVLAEGGSLHARENGDYLERLRRTNRAHLADRLEVKAAALPKCADV